MPNIISNTEEFVTHLLTTELDSNFLYHNLRHTQRVVKSTKELLAFYQLSDQETEAVILAAWFHDTGLTKSIDAHEAASCEIAKSYLQDQGLDQTQVQKICELIMATERQHEPQNLMEEIIRDADASHLRKDSYLETSEVLREEISLLGIADISPKEWRSGNIKLFQTEHRYFTEYAQKNWQEGKDKNLKRLIKNKSKQRQAVKKEELKVKLKNKSPERGIQTMYRVTMKNHLKLSDIADTKANILLSVNAIIISLLLTNLIPKLDNPSNDYLILPSAMFVLFSVASMVMSVLATRPNITSGEFDKEDVKNKKVNLLFFGNFHKMKLADYEWAISEMIKDQSYLYSNLTKDLYFLGVVLNTKYKLLRWTYTIFMIGMILSVIAFFVALKFFGPARMMDIAS